MNFHKSSSSCQALPLASTAGAGDLEAYECTYIIIYLRRCEALPLASTAGDLEAYMNSPSLL